MGNELQTLRKVVTLAKKERGEKKERKRIPALDKDFADHQPPPILFSPVYGCVMCDLNRNDVIPHCFNINSSTILL